MTTPKIIQLKANIETKDGIDEARTREEATVFSIYEGEPGAYKWVADFEDPDNAVAFANRLAGNYVNAVVNQSQFDAVMNQPRPKFPEGFIEWHGGICPVPGAKVLILLRGETECNRTWDWAGDYSWQHDGDSTDIVAYKVLEVLEDAKPAPTSHPHAELMAQYAEDARTTPEPWTLWQCRSSMSEWVELVTSPGWEAILQYRRKPEPKVCECCGQEIKK